jgi:hypothetical protein
MKKALAYLALSFTALATTQALDFDLLSFGSATYSVDSGSTATYSQTPSGITMNTTPTGGDTWYNSSMTPVTSDWSSYLPFSLNMSVTGTNPNFAFSVELFDADFTSINKYSGSTAGLTSIASNAPLTVNIPGTGILTSVQYVQFTWDAGGSAVNATVNKFVGTTVPEPSTYALLGMGALALSGYVVRRRRRA